MVLKMGLEMGKEKLNLKTKLIEIINTLCYKETKKVRRQKSLFNLTLVFH